MKKLMLTLLLALASAGAALGQGAVILPAIAPKPEPVPESKYSPIPKPGYCGGAMLEVGAPGAFGSTAFGVSTTHGVMLTERHFLGAGVGVMHDFSNRLTTVPLYAEGRLYFTSSSGRIYPNIGLRAGAQFASEGGTGFYGGLTMGVRVPLGPRLGLLGEIGPQLVSKYERPTKDASFNKPYRRSGSQFGVVIRLGLTF